MHKGPDEPEVTTRAACIISIVALFVCAILFVAPRISLLDVITMDKSKYAARIDNIYFLDHIGASLRWATENIADEELPANIQHLLARLDRLEAQAKLKAQDPDYDPA